MPLLDDLREAMAQGDTLRIETSADLNAMGPGRRDVFLHATNTGIAVNRDATGEPANILWLPWAQGELQTLRGETVAAAPNGTLFLTYELTGCKLLAITAGPLWHIDAPVNVGQFWPEITGDEWVEDNWPQDAQQNVAYLHRSGQEGDLWNLSDQVQGGQTATYGADNVGNTFVGGIVNGGELDLYYGSAPWTYLGAAAARRIG